MSIHDSVWGFNSSRAVATYEMGRSGYDPAAISFLADRLDLRPGKTVIDLAAGAGKMTRELLALRARLIAVEPLLAMRRRLHDEAVGAEIFEGTADSMPLPDACAHAVVVAQAFHWFDNVEAVGEIHRVLVPGGRLAIVFNRGDPSQELRPVQRALAEMIEPFRGSSPTHRSGEWKAVFSETDEFQSLDGAYFSAEQLVDHEGFIARGLSASFIAALPQSDRERIEERLRFLLAAEPQFLSLRNITQCYLFEKR